jgi:hypothetical protein
MNIFRKIFSRRMKLQEHEAGRLVNSQARTPALRLALAIAFAISAAAFAGETREVTFASPSELTAMLADHLNVDLHWKNNATAAGGGWIEFTTPGDDFIKLDAVWPDKTTFRHPDVAPETKFIYRVRPFFGKPSKAVAVSTGSAPSKPSTEEEGPMDEPGKTTSTDVTHQKSIRSIASFEDASADQVTATLSSPTSAIIRWKDRALDEDGYLLEVSAYPEKDFKICALLPANTTSFRKIQLPPNMKCYFRVRAFFYGEPSNLASVSTPSAAPPPIQVGQTAKHNP